MGAFLYPVRVTVKAQPADYAPYCTLNGYVVSVFQGYGDRAKERASGLSLAGVEEL